MGISIFYIYSTSKNKTPMSIAFLLYAYFLPKANTKANTVQVDEHDDPFMLQEQL